MLSKMAGQPVRRASGRVGDFYEINQRYLICPSLIIDE